MTQKELNVILDKHEKWLNNEEGGERADLSGANLCEADLRGAYLRGADLCEADLRGAYLCGANLCEADLRGAYLRGADLCEADLREADLLEANLCEADLSGANLREADLRGAYLCEADLREAYLRGADLSGANLCEADLRGAYLDYSCWPLWCGALDVKVDARIARQLAYHFCRLDCDDSEYLKARKAIAKFANGFHRVDECGRIEA